ncbi:MAG: TetR-like C-terminal domain-containing protein, partial [Candidatus Latescibacteria bacterium]|nr:TetR-like C-terminal domain-containing protein [Candidatus Latescibacterota bacterium]
YAIHQRGFQILYDMEMTVVDTPDPGERLVKLGQVYIQFALAHRPFYDLMFIESHVQQVISDENHWPEGQNTYSILRQTVHDCIQSGALPHGDVDSVTFAMWSLVHGLVSLIVRGRYSMIPDELMPQVLRSAFAYVNTGLLERNDIPAMLRPDAFQT